MKMGTGFDESQPIFVQIAEMIEDDILNGTYREGDQIISVAQFASTFQVNPATIVKGVALLVNEGILYKKRGLGMYVSADANKLILQKRRARFCDELVAQLLEEAAKLGLTLDEVIEMIKLRNGRESE